MNEAIALAGFLTLNSRSVHTSVRLAAWKKTTSFMEGAPASGSHAISFAQGAVAPSASTPANERSRRFSGRPGAPHSRAPGNRSAQAPADK